MAKDKAKSKPKSVSSAKRYTLVLNPDLYAATKEIADGEGVPVIDILRSFIKFGLWLYVVSHKPDTKIVVREGDSEREIVWK